MNEMKRLNAVSNANRPEGYNKPEKRKTEREIVIEELRRVIKPGDTIYTIVRHVSRSGMSRVIDVYRIVDSEPVRFSWSAAKALDWTYDKRHEGIRVGGCGMDMCFHTVYSLSRVLFPKGFKVDGVGRNGDTSGHDNDGGYALKYRPL